MLTNERFHELLEGTLAGDDASREGFKLCIEQGTLNEEQQKLAVQRSNELMENNIHALLLRVYLHQDGQGGPVDYPAAIALLARPIAQGNGRATLSRAFMYCHGQGEPDGIPNYPAAIALYDGAIGLDYADAMYNRALMYFYGQGEPDGIPNYPAAIALYNRAILLGHPEALHNRTLMYLYGYGEPDNVPAEMSAVGRLSKLRGDLYEKNFLLPAIALFQGARQKDSFFSKLPREIITYILGTVLDESSERTGLGTFFDAAGGRSKRARSAYDNIALSAQRVFTKRLMGDTHSEEKQAETVVSAFSP
jgi:TPR repeat protein